ncbi:MAG TPA: lytic transglycosylase domain-containing protein [Bryobacteraceae bacterium]|nr:lytic transglycosylase domain-containing protein [Bryobacteraceae bacterium]
MAVPALAGEYAVLASGSRIHVDRHESDEEMLRLYAGGGFTEVPAGSVVRFEADDYVAPPTPPVEARPSIAVRPADPKALLRDAAARYVLPPAFVESVAKVESALKSDAVSPKGAIGVMQLMPATARSLAADPNDPEQNIDAGTRLLRELLIKYDGDVAKALAAYNAGPAAVDRYQGIPPFAETQSYVDKVIQNYKQAGGH